MITREQYDKSAKIEINESVRHTNIDNLRSAKNHLTE